MIVEYIIFAKPDRVLFVNIESIIKLFSVIVKVKSPPRTLIKFSLAVTFVKEKFAPFSHIIIANVFSKLFDYKELPIISTFLTLE